MKKKHKFPHFRLFILGAGFSRPAGLPLGCGLFESVRNKIGCQSQVLEKEIEEWTKLYPQEKLDLERVLAYSHSRHYLRLKGPKEYYADGSESIVAARKAIQQVLIKSTPSCTPSLYQRFSKHLSPNDFVLTFNYDTLLEQSLDSISKPYSLTPEWWLSRELTESGEVGPKNWTTS